MRNDAWVLALWVSISPLMDNGLLQLLVAIYCIAFARAKAFLCFTVDFVCTISLLFTCTSCFVLAEAKALRIWWIYSTANLPNRLVIANNKAVRQQGSTPQSSFWVFKAMHSFEITQLQQLCLMGNLDPHNKSSQRHLGHFVSQRHENGLGPILADVIYAWNISFGDHVFFFQKNHLASRKRNVTKNTKPKESVTSIQNSKGPR